MQNKKRRIVFDIPLSSFILRLNLFECGPIVSSKDPHVEYGETLSEIIVYFKMDGERGLCRYGNGRYAVFFYNAF